ncbi:hypothetical protein BC830DRAFT_952437 [Chytriomyces sp. MP71]|nr:hypothetical protein BC830DRAFT_952437 [Chytriomyces sp. MP71]
MKMYGISRWEDTLGGCAACVSCISGWDFRDAECELKPDLRPRFRTTSVSASASLPASEKVAANEEKRRRTCLCTFVAFGSGSAGLGATTVVAAASGIGTGGFGSSGHPAKSESTSIGAYVSRRCCIGAWQVPAFAPFPPSLILDINECVKTQSIPTFFDRFNFFPIRLIPSSAQCEFTNLHPSFPEIQSCATPLCLLNLR